MNHAIRSFRNCHHPPAIFLSPNSSLLHRTTTSIISFRRATTTVTSTPGNPHNMDKTQNQDEKTGDVMSHSFGEGYSTRSDEEGFGGIYGGNQSVNNVEMDKKIHENHPAYDKTQGSEVKEKEKARHQTNGQS
ncbi:hypothetical protein P3X46_029287 [Hevea brasiliensis]|uniref:Uncharacterized protein n=1 Tax=Hevea brasiliensis TaxID=3981 RepID=A0ABQ9KRP1_HEVBR|nr:uncharacterized protein LOC110634367 [Hevea brasiliensis]KAJ9147085.1 hypothetical protein P3X46_029287 [Hevea brasiliensis]